MSRSLLIVSLGVALCVAGCGTDPKRFADQDVEERLLKDMERTEAIPFFEQNGRYFDFEGGKTTVDRDVVLPLLKRLKEIAGTDQWIILRDDDKNWAFALLVGLPQDAQTVDRMAAAVKEADETFSGFILQQWGHEWLSIILINEKSYEFLRKRNPDIEKQGPRV